MVSEPRPALEAARAAAEQDRASRPPGHGALQEVLLRLRELRASLPGCPQVEAAQECSRIGRTSGILPARLPVRAAVLHALQFASVYLVH